MSRCLVLNIHLNHLICIYICLFTPYIFAESMTRESEAIRSQLKIEDNQFSQKEMVQQLKCRIHSYTTDFGGLYNISKFPCIDTLPQKPTKTGKQETFLTRVSFATIFGCQSQVFGARILGVWLPSLKVT